MSMPESPRRARSRSPVAAPLVGAPLALLRECFDLFHASACGVARLSIETSNDLFEMDASVTTEAVLDFKARRKEWPGAFGEALRQLFENRVAGNRRKGRRPDAEQSFRSLARIERHRHPQAGRARRAHPQLHRRGQGGTGSAGSARRGAVRRAAEPRDRQPLFAGVPARRHRHDVALALRRTPDLALGHGARGHRLHPRHREGLHPAQSAAGRARRPARRRRDRACAKLPAPQGRRRSPAAVRSAHQRGASVAAGLAHARSAGRARRELPPAAARGQPVRLGAGERRRQASTPANADPNALPAPRRDDVAARAPADSRNARPVAACRSRWPSTCAIARRTASTPP